MVEGIRLRKGWFSFLFLMFLIVATAGCGSVRHKIDFKNNYVPAQGTQIELGGVENKTGETFDIEIEKMFTEALNKALNKRKLLWNGGQGPKLTLSSKIIEYKKGNAFQRWLLPGWGSTVLSIQGDLRDSNNILVGSMEARRSVSFGGGYTIGAWRTIFSSVAEDMIRDLELKVQTAQR